MLVNAFCCLFMCFFSKLYLLISGFILVSATHANTNLNFQESTIVSLDGHWTYYPNQLLMDKNNHHKLAPINVVLPSSFEDITGNKDAIGSFQQTFRIPHEAINKQIYLYIPFQYGAYEIYVDGQSVAQVGTVGDSNQHITMMAPKLTSFFAKDNDIQITIHASAYHHIRGGLENSILIGYSKPILYYFYKQVIPLCVLSGILIMLSSFMVLFSVYRSYQGYIMRGWLMLGLFVLCLSIRSFFAVPFIYTLFTDISWIWGTRFEYLLSELACLFFLIYIYLLPQKPLHKIVLYIVSLIIISNIFTTLFYQPIVFQNYYFNSFLCSMLVFADLLYGFFRIYRNNISYSKLNACAIFIICLAFLNDFLLGMKLINSFEVAFYASCLYFVLVTLYLSKDYATKSYNTEILNYELRLLNRSLDQQVLERTQTVVLLNQQLEKQLKIDALTGAYNRYALNEQTVAWFNDASAKSETLAFFMLDVDFFKKYNDHYGHLNGDTVLKDIVKSLQQVIPQQAYLARYGGEEFAIIIRNIDVNFANNLAKQCLYAIAELNIEHIYRDDETHYITMSIGGAIYDGNVQNFLQATDLMKKADQNLYLAKRTRNTWVVE